MTKPACVNHGMLTVRPLKHTLTWVLACNWLSVQHCETAEEENECNRILTVPIIVPTPIEKEQRSSAEPEADWKLTPL